MEWKRSAPLKRTKNPWTFFMEQQPSNNSPFIKVKELATQMRTAAFHHPCDIYTSPKLALVSQFSSRKCEHYPVFYVVDLQFLFSSYPSLFQKLSSMGLCSTSSCAYLKLLQFYKQNGQYRHTTECQDKRSTLNKSLQIQMLKAICSFIFLVIFSVLSWLFNMHLFSEEPKRLCGFYFCNFKATLF